MGDLYSKEFNRRTRETKDEVTEIAHSAQRRGCMSLNPTLLLFSFSKGGRKNYIILFPAEQCTPALNTAAVLQHSRKRVVFHTSSEIQYNNCQRREGLNSCSNKLPQIYHEIGWMGAQTQYIRFQNIKFYMFDFFMEIYTLGTLHAPLYLPKRMYNINKLIV